MSLASRASSVCVNSFMCVMPQPSRIEKRSRTPLATEQRRQTIFGNNYIARSRTENDSTPRQLRFRGALRTPNEGLRWATMRLECQKQLENVIVYESGGPSRRNIGWKNHIRLCWANNWISQTEGNPNPKLETKPKSLPSIATMHFPFKKQIVARKIQCDMKKHSLATFPSILTDVIWLKRLSSLQLYILADRNTPRCPPKIFIFQKIAPR